MMMTIYRGEAKVPVRAAKDADNVQMKRERRTLSRVLALRVALPAFTFGMAQGAHYMHSVLLLALA